jgi:hypothetical protein
LTGFLLYTEIPLRPVSLLSVGGRQAIMLASILDWLRDAAGHTEAIEEQLMAK